MEDFHSLTRRQLQALCKKNKIPANITNVAMAHALEALPTVQGIEELFLVNSESSTESPAKSHIASVTVPHTTRRSARNMITVKEDECETLRSLTRTRCSTRRPVAAAEGGREADLFTGTAGPNKIAQSGQKSALAASVCRNIDNTNFHEVEEKEKEEMENLSETPAVVPAGRKRGTLEHTYSTRRSARFAEKKDVEEDFNSIKVEEGSDAVKTELLSNDFGEILEMNVKEHSPVESHPVTEFSVTGVDLKDKTEQGYSDNSYNAEVVAATKSDFSIQNCNNFQIGYDENSGENFEIGESKMTVECDGGGKDGDDRCDNEPNELYTDKLEDALENRQGLDTNAEMGSNHVAAEDIAQFIDHKSNKDFGVSNDLNAFFEEGKKLNEEMERESEDGAAQNLINDEKDTNSVLNINDGVVESKESGEYLSDLFVHKTEEQAVGFTSTPALKSAVDISASAVDEYKSSACLEEYEMSSVENGGFQVEHSVAEEQCRKSISDDNVVLEPEEELKDHNVALELESSIQQQQGAVDDVSSPFLLDSSVSHIKVVTRGDITVLPRVTANSNENLTDVVVVFPTSSLTPTSMKKKSGSKKTPTEAAKIMMMTQVSDDKENINNSRTSLIIAKEKEKKHLTREEISQKPLDGQSLRQLTKMLKEKLEIINDKTNTNNSKAASTARPALQALSENRLD